LLVVIALLLLLMGLSKLNATTELIHENNVELTGIQTNLTRLVSEMKEPIEKFFPKRDNLISFMRKEACPKHTEFASTDTAQNFFGDYTPITAFDGTQPVFQILGLSESLVETIENLNLVDTLHGTEFLNSTALLVEDLVEGLESLQTSMDHGGMTVTMLIVALIMIAFLLHTAFLICVLGLPYHRLSKTVQLIIFPIFVLLITAVTLICAGLIAALQSNADFCVGDSDSPQDSIEGIVRSLSTAEVENIVTFYTSQCQLTKSSPGIAFAPIETIYHSLVDSKIALSELVESMDMSNLLDNIPPQCGTIDFSAVTDGYQLQAHLTNLATSLESIMVGPLNCDTIVPIYTSLVYDGLCDYSFETQYWFFFCLLVISLCGMTMLTFRAACYLPTAEVSDDVASNTFRESSFHRNAHKMKTRQTGDGQPHSVSTAMDLDSEIEWSVGEDSDSSSESSLGTIAERLDEFHHFDDDPTNRRIYDDSMDDLEGTDGYVVDDREEHQLEM